MADARPGLPRALGGISLDDPAFTEFPLEEGDVLIIVGTGEGLRRAAEILSL